MASFVTVKVDFSAVNAQLAGMRDRLAAPLGGSAGPAVIDAMRRGPGSVEEQFKTSSEFGEGFITPWTPTQQFGSLAPPELTLVRSSALRDSWTGAGSGSIEALTPNTVEIGSSLPIAGIFQRETPITVVPHTVGKRGLAMQSFLWIAFRVKITAARLQQGLVIPPRRVGVGTQMVRRVIDIVTNYVAGGES